MTLERLEHSGDAVVTTTTNAMTTSSTSISLASATGWPSGTYPFYVTIDGGTSSEEKVLCSALSGTTLTVETRGADGTTAVAHAIGASIKHTFTAVEADDVNDHVYTTTRDDHTQYARTDGTRSITGSQTFEDNVTVDGNLTVDGETTLTGAVSMNGIVSGPGDFVGEVRMTAGATAPNSDWHLCDGSALSRTTYAALFAYVGTTYGAGDGSTTFNIPDTRDLIPMGAGTTYPLGTGGGAATATLSTANMPAHNHAITDPGHAHSTSVGTESATHTHNFPVSNIVQEEASTVGLNPLAGGGVAATGITGLTTSNEEESHSHTVTVESATTGISTQDAGSGDAFSILPPYLPFNFIIRIL